MNPGTCRRVAFLATILAAGCGGQSDEVAGPTGTLSGKLTFGGRAVPATTGIVFQHVATGRLYLAKTDAAGAFKVEDPTSNMPTGRYDVSIAPAAVEDVTAGAEPVVDGAAPPTPAAPPPIQIPAKYRNAHESGLGFELVAGANDKTFDLKP